MSTLFVNNLNTASGTTITVPTGKSLIAPGMVLQGVYNTPSGNNTQRIDDVSTQASLNINNATTRGTCTCSVTRKDANSFFLIEVGVTAYRPTTAGELRIGYRIGSGSDVVSYVQDNVSWSSNTKTFKDTTSGSAGDALTFESVFTNTGATTNALRHVYMNVLEIAQ